MPECLGNRFVKRLDGTGSRGHYPSMPGVGPDLTMQWLEALASAARQAGATTRLRFWPGPGPPLLTYHYYSPGRGVGWRARWEFVAGWRGWYAWFSADFVAGWFWFWFWFLAGWRGKVRAKNHAQRVRIRVTRATTRIVNNCRCR